jgi:isoleucyl-tRNA synthetase
MSKSLGNVVAPEEIIKTNGAEILRLLFASVEYTADTCFSKNLLVPLLESYRKIRNTCRFLIGNIYDFDPTTQRVAYADLPEVEQWILHRTSELVERGAKAYESFAFHHIVHDLINFCAVDLSSLYLDIAKDRLYTAARDSQERRAAQTVLWDILDAMVRLMAPILSFTAEEIWTHLPSAGRTESVFLAGIPSGLPRNDALAQKWDRLLEVRTAVTKALEEARQSGLIGHSLDARVTVGTADEALRALLREQALLLPALFITSQVGLDDDLGEEVASALLPALRLKIERARGDKCERCWNYSEEVGKDGTHPGLCERCLPVVQGWQGYDVPSPQA